MYKKRSQKPGLLPLETNATENQTARVSDNLDEKNMNQSIDLEYVSTFFEDPKHRKKLRVSLQNLDIEDKQKLLEITSKLDSEVKTVDSLIPATPMIKIPKHQMLLTSSTYKELNNYYQNREFTPQKNEKSSLSNEYPGFEGIPADNSNTDGNNIIEENTKEKEQPGDSYNHETNTPNQASDNEYSSDLSEVYNEAFVLDEEDEEKLKADNQGLQDFSKLGEAMLNSIRKNRTIRKTPKKPVGYLNFDLDLSMDKVPKFSLEKLSDIDAQVPVSDIYTENNSEPNESKDVLYTNDLDFYRSINTSTKLQLLDQSFQIPDKKTMFNEGISVNSSDNPLKQTQSMTKHVDFDEDSKFQDEEVLFNTLDSPSIVKKGRSKKHPVRSVDFQNFGINCRTDTVEKLFINVSHLKKDITSIKGMVTEIYKALNLHNDAGSPQKSPRLQPSDESREFNIEDKNSGDPTVPENSNTYIYNPEPETNSKSASDDSNTSFSGKEPSGSTSEQLFPSNKKTYQLIGHLFQKLAAQICSFRVVAAMINFIKTAGRVSYSVFMDYPLHIVAVLLLVLAVEFIFLDDYIFQF
ncbi:hypothetical protein BB560_000561 [Smittium megazygosporum]|uniref:Uncharacterized protein n=1 Tax=Smittium megazygosporum TaxID=133381 RepID=A0A2T9ZK20_9FUNG|nr:hypothetical protein BB560_000561 [Smittium megazygosporum]